jgi:hypothetical protein
MHRHLRAQPRYEGSKFRTRFSKNTIRAARQFICISFTLLLYCPTAIGADTADSLIKSLPATQQEKLDSFQPIILKLGSRGRSTEVIVLRRVQAPPHHVAALFNDYASAPRIFSSLRQTRLVQTSGPKVVIDYTLRLPLPVDVSYRMLHTTEGPSQGVHATKWRLVSSPVLEDAEGAIHFHPYKSGTLIQYQTKVTPVRLLSGMLKQQAPKEALKAVEELARAASKGEQSLNLPMPEGRGF